MDLDLKGKTAIVAGGSRGIGRAIALGLAAEGCNLALAARDAGKLAETARAAEKLGVRAITSAGDLNQTLACSQVVESALEAFGRVDILVTSIHVSLSGAGDAVWREGMNTLFLIAVRLGGLVAEPMREQGGGVILHLSSIWGREAGGHPAYNAAKAALISHVKSSAEALARDNIRVLSLAPGSVSHPGGTWWRRQQEDPEGMSRFVQENIPMGRFGTAEEIANVAVFLCSPRASWVTGSTVVVDGGQSRANF